MPLYDPERLRSALDDVGAAAVIATSARNIRYLTGLGRSAGCLVVATRGQLERPVLIIPAADIDFILEVPYHGVDVVAYGGFYRAFRPKDELDERERIIQEIHGATRWDESLLDVAVSVLAARGLRDDAVVADQTSDATEGLKGSLPGADLRVHRDFFPRLRIIKTPEEIDRLSRAAAITEDAIGVTAAQIRPGITQDELAMCFRTEVVRQAEVRADNVSVGRGSALGNVNLPNDRVDHGAVIRFDVGAIYRGYAADIARCYACGQPDGRLARSYEAILRGQEAVLAKLVPGASAAELFQIATRTVRKSGIPDYQRTHVGHGMGLAGGYDLPLLAPHDETRLQPGMVLCVETPYYEVGGFGVQVEDMVVVTETGFSFLSRTDRGLRVVG